ncbi:MAG TPA: alkaline phosphatase family protein [Terriglobales bacterium]|nr:alkaline phosphatase family protein [Terriglobales bacterium]
MPDLRRWFAFILVVPISCLMACQGLRSPTANITPAATPTPTPAATPSPTPGSINSLNHIILFMQENRSFDHYFGQINSYRASLGLPQEVDTWGPGKTPAVVATVSYDPATGRPGPPIPAFHMQSACSENLSSSWNESHREFNLNDHSDPTAPPAMDGFAFIEGKFANDSNILGFGKFLDVTGKRAMGFYDQTDLPFYYFMASNFATSDRWFSPAPTRTHPNRFYWMAATSQGNIIPPQTQLTAKPIFQELDNANISWKIYLAGKNTYYSYFAYSNTHKTNVVPIAQYFTDVANGTLPQVAYIETGVEVNLTSVSALDEHPDNDIQVGAQFSQKLITALMNSPSWKDSVFLQTYDEGGGFYDHVPPMPEVSPDGIPPILTPNNIAGDFTVSGFRVPMFVVSPFARKNFVSHTPMDFTAALKLIETRFGLAPLTARDAAMPDMTEFFDFSTSTGPWAVPPTNVPQQTKNLPCTQGVPAG